MKGVNLTSDKIGSAILRFSIPLMLGDLFQQLYIAVDSALVGQYSTSCALAAVTSSTFLIRLIGGFFMGITAGASVVVSHYFGAKRMEKVKEALHTIVLLAILGGILFVLVGVGITIPLLQIVATPSNVMPDATIYLRIYFMGSMFNMIYNVGSGILYAVGDSKKPFYFLVFSSLLNILLDSLFIAIFQWGVAGAALATVFSQGCSAILMLLALRKLDVRYALHIRKLYLNKKMVANVFRMGVPAGLQSAIIGLSNVMVQTKVNQFGTEAMAGFGIFNKVDGILMLPVSNIALAMTTFTGQNYGAGKLKRVKKGIYTMVWLQILGWILGSVCCLTFGSYIFSLFTKEQAVIEYTKLSMYYLLPGYAALGIGYSLTCIYRGMGKSTMAALLFIFSMCFVRQIWILFANHLHLGMEGILLSYPVSWIMSLVVGAIYGIYLSRKGEFKEVR